MKSFNHLTTPPALRMMINTFGLIFYHSPNRISTMGGYLQAIPIQQLDRRSDSYNHRVPLSLDLAHRRYLQQARWTEQLRGHILTRAGLPNAHRVLEVGCGTGAVLRSIVPAPRTRLYGLDIDQPSLQIAKQEASTALLSYGDAHRLPYAAGSFDIVFTHFVLLWLAEPARALADMRRVTRHGGAVLALAEPDYSQRVDQPAAFAELGRLQTEVLRAQGADTEIGSKLGSLFAAAGFSQIDTGKLDASERGHESEADWRLEAEVLRADLAGRVEQLLAEDERAWQAGTRVLYVPTYYAWARVI
jgi:ubiquinone/menaquinone biosynthesis C-methylase UbiE